MSENLNKESATIYMTDHGELKLSPDTVRQYLVSGGGSVTKQEIMMFLALCKYQKLNPFLREAYLIKFGNSPATIVTGKEVFTKRASKIENCNGWKAGVIILTDNGLEEREGTLVLKTEQLVGGWCEVHRKDWIVPLKATVSLEEYARYKKDGQLMDNWAKMPATMIRKVALVQALRDTFPEDFQGMYSPEEMPVDSNTLNEKPVEIPIEIIETDDKTEKFKQSLMNYKDNMEELAQAAGQ